MNQKEYRFVVRCPGCSTNLRYANSNVINSLLLRCPDCSHPFVAKCDGVKQISGNEVVQSNLNPREEFLQNRPNSRSSTSEVTFFRSKGLWRAAVITGAALLVIFVVLPLAVMLLIPESMKYERRIARGLDVPRVELPKRIQPPKNTNPPVPSFQKPNTPTPSIPLVSPKVDGSQTPKPPRSEANAPDYPTRLPSRFEPPDITPPNMTPPEKNPSNMDRPNMERPKGTFDRPGFPPFDPNRPNGPTRPGPPPGMNFGPPGSPTVRPTLDNFTGADGVRIFITKAKGLNALEIVSKLKSDLAIRGHTMQSSGDSISIGLRYSGALQTIVDRIDFGKVIEVDEETRVIRIEVNEP